MRIAIAATFVTAASALVGCSLSEPNFTNGNGPTGAAAALTPAQPSYDFGTLVLGAASAPASMQFTNTGHAATGELSAAALSGPGAVLFTIASDGCAHHVLVPGDSCTVSAMLSPSSAGASSATLMVGGSPGGMASVALTGTIVEPGALHIDPPAAAFGGVGPGATSSDTAFSITNTGGASSGKLAVTISGSDASQFAMAGDNCSGAILGAGATCTVKAHFAPAGPGARAASLTIASPAAGTAVATLGGNGLVPATLTITPPATDVGAVVLGATSATTAIVIANTGQLPTSTLSIAQSGDAGQFQRTSDACSGNTLNPAASCVVTYAFSPMITGKATLSLAISGASAAATATISGTGIPPAALVFNPASDDFGQVDVGTTSVPTAFVLTNTGGQATSTVTASLRGAFPGDYTLASDGCTGKSLAAGASCTISLAFAPTVFGSRSATLQADATVGGTTTASLTGTGRDKLTLTVHTNGGAGTGTVSASMPGLICTGTTCTGQFYRGSSLTLTATPDANNLFNGWSGDCTGTGNCQLSVNATLNVTATFVPATEDLMFATSGQGGASGAISFSASPAGTGCGTGCLRFPNGTRVTLTAQPTAGFYFSSWAGDCVGNGLGCVLTMTAGHTVSAAFAPANLAFVTSGSFVPSSVNTAQWADSTCQSAAQAAGLPGTFIGWIGDGSNAWPTRLGNASGWIRRDGKPFATSKAELTAGHSLYPLDVDEHGKAIPPTALVNSGIPINATGPANCNGWTQTLSSNTFQLPGQAGGGWSQAATYDFFDDNMAAARCGSALPLYCVQTDYGVNLTYAKATGRIAFLGIRTTTDPNGGGLAAIDQFCADKASAAGLAGSFRALIATTTTTAAARFSTTGQPWVRADGVPIVAQAADLFAAGGPALTASLDVDEHGAVGFGLMMAGAPDLNTLGTVATTCNNYTDNASSDKFFITGYSSFVNGGMFGYGQNQCMYGGSFYCLQQ